MRGSGELLGVGRTGGDPARVEKRARRARQRVAQRLSVARGRFACVGKEHVAGHGIFPRLHELPRSPGGMGELPPFLRSVGELGLLRCSARRIRSVPDRSMVRI